MKRRDVSQMSVLSVMVGSQESKVQDKNPVRRFFSLFFSDNE